MHRSPLGTPGGCFTAFGLHPPAMPGALAASRLSSGFRGISSPASGLRYSTVHLTAFHLRIPIRWNHMIRFQCVGIGGLGAKPSSEAVLGVALQPGRQALQRLSRHSHARRSLASIKTVFPRLASAVRWAPA